MCVITFDFEVTQNIYYIL